MGFFNDADLELVKQERRADEATAVDTTHREQDRRQPLCELLLEGLRAFPAAARQVNLPIGHMWRWEKVGFWRRRKVDWSYWTIAYLKNDDYLPIPVNLSVEPSDDEIREVADTLSARHSLRVDEVRAMLEDALRGCPRSFD